MIAKGPNPGDLCFGRTILYKSVMTNGQPYGTFRFTHDHEAFFIVTVLPGNLCCPVVVGNLEIGYVWFDEVVRLQAL
jgi:hypothetical protein